MTSLRQSAIYSYCTHPHKLNGVQEEGIKARKEGEREREREREKRERSVGAIDRAMSVCD